MARLLVALLVLHFAAPARAGVSWSKGDFAAAQKAAKAQKKRLLVDVFATWCGPCQQMDRAVYARGDVAAAVARSFVALKVDAEAGEGPALVKRFHVVGYPTLLVLDADGAEIDRIFGEVPADAFIRTIGAYAKGEGTLASLEQAYFERGLFDAAAAADLSKRASVKGDLDRARFYLDEVERIAQAFADVPQRNEAKLAAAVARASVEAMRRVQMSFLKDGIQKQREASERGHAEARKALRDAELTYAKYGLLRGAKDYDGAAQVLRKLMLEHAGTAEADAAQVQLAYALSGAGDRDGAKKAIDAYLARHAADREAGAFNTYAWFCFKEGLFLEDGIAAATRGLAIDAKDAGLWDTLAELQFKAGRPSEAVASARKASALKPADPYLKSQIKKFSVKN